MMQHDRAVMDESKSQCQIWGQFVRAGTSASPKPSLFITTSAYLKEASVLWLWSGTFSRRRLRQEPAVSNRADSLTAWWGIVSPPRPNSSILINQYCRHQCSRGCRMRSCGLLCSPAALWETPLRTWCIAGILSTTLRLFKWKAHISMN